MVPYFFEKKNKKNNVFAVGSSVADQDLFVGSGNFTTKSGSGSSSVFLKKDLFLCNIVHIYIYKYLLRRGDSSIEIGKATRHHKFNND
jgi:hypothetical protein